MARPQAALRAMSGGVGGVQGRKKHEVQHSTGCHLLWPDMLHRTEQGQIITGIFTCGWIIQ